MHNGIKIICDRLMMHPESCLEGALITEWTHAARNVIENQSGIFTEEEVNAVKDAWKEAQRANFFGIVVEMVGNSKAAKRLAPTEGQKTVVAERERQNRLQEMMEYAARRDPTLAREIQKMEYERASRAPVQMWQDSTSGKPYL